MTAPSIHPAQISLPPSAPSLSRATQKELAQAAAPSLRSGKSVNLDAVSSAPTYASSGVLATEPLAGLPHKPVTAMTAEHFGEQVAALARQTKLARNVMPMLVRGGLMAGVGMLIFGHLAPLAIVATIMGAVVGGYAIAKVLQMHQAKKFAALGENNPLTLLKNNVPSDASQADLDKLNGIISFIERGNVFEEGFIKSFREPYRAIKNRVSAMLKPPEAPRGAAVQDADDAASLKRPASVAESIKQAYLNEKKV